MLDDFTDICERESELDALLKGLAYEEHHVFFVHLNVDDGQIYNRRKGQRIDPASMTIVTREAIQKAEETLKKKDSSEEELENDSKNENEANDEEHEPEDDEEEDSDKPKRVKYVPIDPTEQYENKDKEYIDPKRLPQ